uniref:Nucleoprotein n=2 Tax=Isavirus salaris TaxID=55987 RepID=A0A1S5WFQ6_9ORTO|nr:nucleoprotein [Infectious salmon anemia virus]AQQ10512.1 nucleoprotein [Infectious salmon anemia virus]
MADKGMTYSFDVRDNTLVVRRSTATKSGIKISYREDRGTSLLQKAFAGTDDEFWLELDQDVYVDKRIRKFLEEEKMKDMSPRVSGSVAAAIERSVEFDNFSKEAAANIEMSGEDEEEAGGSGMVDNKRRNKGVSNMAYNLSLFIGMVFPAITTFFSAILSEGEMSIWQNGQAIMRILALADEDGKRQTRTGGQRVDMADVTKLNVVTANGKVKQVEVNLNDLKAAFRQSRPKRSDYRKGQGSKATESSISNQCMALIMKSVLSADQLFAPGVKMMRTNGFNASYTTLAEGANIPSKYLRHMRNCGGVALDLMGMKRIKNSPEGAKSKIFSIIQKKVRGRCRTEEQRLLTSALKISDGENKFQRIMDTLCTSFLIDPPRTTKCFIPPISSLLMYIQDGNSVLAMDFMKNGGDACRICREAKLKVGVNGTFTMSVARTCVAVSMVATAFCSADIIENAVPGSERYRSNIKANTTKPKKDSTYTIQGLRLSNVKYEARPETSQSNTDRSWQVNVTDSFGGLAVFNQGAIREMLGDGTSETTSVNVRALVKRILKSASERSARAVKTFMVGEQGKSAIVISGVGLFSIDFEGVEEAERITDMTPDIEFDEDDEEEEDTDI